MKILIAYDGSTHADMAVADLQRAGLVEAAEVLVINVVELRAPDAMVTDFPVAATSQPSKVEMNEAKGLATKACNWIQSHFPQWKVSALALSGTPTKVILEKIQSWNPDLLIVGSHGRSSAARLFLGSVSLKLAHEAPCSVRVVRTAAPTDHRPIRIAAGCDGSAESDSVIQEIARRSWPENSEVHIVSIIETIAPIAYSMDPAAFSSEPALSAIQESVERQRARFREIVEQFRERLQRAGLIVSAVEIEGNPQSELVEAAKRWNADTFFIGARGHGRLEEILLGSVSTSVLKHAHCVVEVVRKRGSD